jgi:hypothetical protein
MAGGLANPRLVFVGVLALAFHLNEKKEEKSSPTASPGLAGHE